MADLSKSLAELAVLARTLRPEATLRQYFIQALDDYLKEANLFPIDPGPLFRLDERIIRGKPDSRLGALTFEVKLPKPHGQGLPAAIKQVRGYIDEYAQQSLLVRGVAYDGESIALLNEQKEIIFEGQSPEGATLLCSWLTLLAPAAKTPEDMVNRFGSPSSLSRNSIKMLYDLFFRFESEIPFIEEVFTIWKAVYGCAANINKETVQGLRKTGRELGITIKGKKEAEKFVFALETYLSILLKLLVARVAVEQELIPQSSVFELICEPPGQEHIRYTELSSFIPHLASVFEEDPFDWFIDAAKADKSAEASVRNTLRSVAESIDNVHLLKMGQDFLRVFYQHFFDTASRRALGEFYTNSDLVRKALDAVDYDGSVDKPIIDFCCGSGNFLIEILKRVKAKGKNRKSALLLGDIEKNVFGVDIHPLAVAMARVNFIIAVAPLLKRDYKFHVPVYWADSLVRLAAKKKSRKLDILGEPVKISVPGMKTFNLPDPDRFDWEGLFEFCRQHIGNIAGKADFNRVWQRFEQEYPREEILPFEDALKDFIAQLVDRRNSGRDTRWLPMLRNILLLERQKGKFQYIVGNPPWVRIHNIDEELRKRINEDYSFCADAGWERGCQLAGIGRGFARQTDLCVPFVERAFELLAPGGYFSFVITSKVQAALYANALRRELVQEKTLVRLSDYSLDPLPLFEGAVNYPLILSVRNQKPRPDSKCLVEVTNSQKEKRLFEVPQKELSLLGDDPESPWLMAPPEAVAVFRKMQADGEMLGEDDALRPRRGIMTAANDIYIVTRVDPTESPKEVMVTTDGGAVVRIEKEMLRPLIRGRDLRPWGFTLTQGIIWTHDDQTAQPLQELPARAAEYFSDEKIIRTLKDREDYKTHLPIWSVFRAGPEKLSTKVCWKELANEMQATPLDKSYSFSHIGKRRLIPLHTAYLIPTETHDEAVLLAAIFNSVPFRAFVMAFAPRARGGYFRHFSWTVGMTPVPSALLSPNAKRIGINKRNNSPNGSLILRIGNNLLRELTGGERSRWEAELNARISELYGLSTQDLAVLLEYYRFMRPPEKELDLLEEADSDDL